MEWDFNECGFDIINLDFPQNDVPHGELILKINTRLKKLNDENYSISGSPLPLEGQKEILENLKKSIDKTLGKIKKIHP